MQTSAWKNGDIVIFFGDSITAAEKYTRILIDFYVLHYPEKNILFYNAAIPGLSTRFTIDNFETLVSGINPTAATVMFGMNDLQPALYADSAKITDALCEKRARAFNTYCENVKLLDSMLGHIPHIFFTPTPHDENPRISAPLYGGYDIALQRAASWITDTFSPSLDLHTPLTRANACRLTETIIGPDRVHPGNIGHCLIAYKILEAQGFLNPRLPMWDETITDEEKSILARLGIYADNAAKNPFSDARAAASRRFILHRYVEMNVLAGQGISPEDTARADAFLKKQIAMPIEKWRIEAYEDYMQHRLLGDTYQAEAEYYMKKMYFA